MARSSKGIATAWPAPAKINLFLHITGRRPDGYHELQTLFQLLDWGDEIRVQVTADPEKKTMQIALQRGSVTLTFTDKPWPTKEELEKIKAEEKKNAPRKSLFDALKNAAEETFQHPQIELEE